LKLLNTAEGKSKMSDLKTRSRFSTTLNNEIKKLFDNFISKGNLKKTTICDEALVDIMVKYGYPVPKDFIKKGTMRFTDIEEG
jgi:hypothetical protein